MSWVGEWCDLQIMICFTSKSICEAYPGATPFSLLRFSAPSLAFAIFSFLINFYVIGNSASLAVMAAGCVFNDLRFTHKFSFISFILFSIYFY